MKEEICAAASFLTRLVGKNEDLSLDQAEVFKSTLGTVLMEKFRGHWFPEKPCKGQAFRCIRVNSRERRDPVLEQAAEMCGLRYDDLKLPVELTVWVDPLEVCCRFGEDEGSYCTVASFKENKENLSDNIIEEIPSSNSHQNSPDCLKKQQKTRRKPLLEKPKKVSTTRNPPTVQNPTKGFSSKSPLIPTKGIPCPTYFDWNPAYRFPRTYPDLAFLRRPRKQVRSTYTNDRYHWAKK